MESDVKMCVPYSKTTVNNKTEEKTSKNKEAKSSERMQGHEMSESHL